MITSPERSRDGAQHWRFMGKQHEEELAAPRGVIRGDELSIEDRRAAHHYKMARYSVMRERVDNMLQELSCEREREQHRQQQLRREKAAAVITAALRAGTAQRFESLVCYCCGLDVPVEAHNLHLNKCRPSTEHQLRQLGLNPLKAMPAEPSCEVPLSVHGEAVEMYNTESTQNFMRSFVECVRCHEKFPVQVMTNHRSSCYGDHTDFLDASYNSIHRTGNSSRRTAAEDGNASGGSG